MSLAMEVLKAKRQELQSQIAELRKGLREIDAALEVLDPQDPGRSLILQMAPGSGKSHINASIIEAVRQGSGTLVEIYDYMTNQLSVDTTKASVSTRLSKMKNDGMIDHDGDKWIMPEKAEGPGAETPEPSNTELGPVGRERGYPPSAPEGSIPSGSTVVQDLQAGLANVQATMPARSRELDDEIPF